MSEVIKSIDVRSDNDDDDDVRKGQGQSKPKKKSKSQTKAKSQQSQPHCWGCSIKTWRRCVRLPFVLCVTAMTVYVCVLSSERYFKYWVQTSIELTDLHVSEIPFPAVTICPLTANIANDTSNSEDAELYNLFNQAQNILWQTSDSNQINTDNIKNNNTQLFSTFYAFRNVTCKDLFADCQWRRLTVPCCSLFRRLKVLQGACYSFNALDVYNPEPTWPWSVADSGAHTALDIRIRRPLEKVTVESVGIIVHEPHEYLGVGLIHSKSDRIVVPIEPLRFTADLEVKSLPLSMRHCYFIHEIGKFTKSRSDCIRNCNLRYIFQKCNCTYQFEDANPLEQQGSSFSRASSRNCSVRDLPCFKKYRLSLYSMSNVIEESTDNIFTTLDCGCYPNCNHMQYHTSTYTEHLSSSETNGTFIELDVYFQEETMFSYRSTLRFTIIDLMVAYGGIAGLFMGISVIGCLDAVLNRLTCNKLRIRPI